MSNENKAVAAAGTESAQDADLSASNGVLETARVAQQKVMELAARFAGQMIVSIRFILEAFLDKLHETDKVRGTFLTYLAWQETKLAHSEPEVRRACWAALFKGAFTTEFRSFEELRDVLDWLAGKNRLVKLPENVKKGSLYNYGKYYNFPPEVLALLTREQVDEIVADLIGAREKLWPIVWPKWIALDQKMKSRGNISSQQLIDGWSGDCYLQVPCQLPEPGQSASMYREGGSLLVRSDGNVVRVIAVANERYHPDGKTDARDNFGQAFREAMEKGVFIYYDTLVTRRELDLSGLDKFFAEKIHLYRRKIWAGHWNMLKAAQTQPAGTSAS